MHGVSLFVSVRVHRVVTKFLSRWGICQSSRVATRAEHALPSAEGARPQKIRGVQGHAPPGNFLQI